MNAPKDDRFMVITENPAEGFVADPSYLDIQRSKDCVFNNARILRLPIFVIRCVTPSRWTSSAALAMPEGGRRTAKPPMHGETSPTRRRPCAS